MTSFVKRKTIKTIFFFFSIPTSLPPPAFFLWPKLFIVLDANHPLQIALFHGKCFHQKMSRYVASRGFHPTRIHVFLWNICPLSSPCRVSPILQCTLTLLLSDLVETGINFNHRLGSTVLRLDFAKKSETNSLELKVFEKLGSGVDIPLGLGCFLSPCGWQPPAAQGNSTCFIQPSSTDISQVPLYAPWNEITVVRWCTTENSSLCLSESTHLSIYRCC